MSLSDPEPEVRMDHLRIVGFDSAWRNSPKAPGAVCVIRQHGSGWEMCREPTLASFQEALNVIRQECQSAAVCLVALDQPTIVPNMTGARPVDRVAASLISWMG